MKKVITLVLGMILAFSLISISVSAEVTIPAVADFEAGEVGASAQTLQTAYLGFASEAHATIVEKDGGKVMQLSGENNGRFYVYPAAIGADQATVEFDIFIETPTSTGANSFNTEFKYKGTWAWGDNFKVDDTAHLNNAGWLDGVSYTYDKWCKMSFAFDFTTKTCTWYIDGVKMGEAYSFDIEATFGDTYMNVGFPSTHCTTNIFIDNVSYKEGLEPTVPEQPTDPTPDDNNDTPSSPDTADTMMGVALVSVAAAAVLVLKRKQK